MERRKLLLGFGHKKGSGKDTAADFAASILHDLGWPVRRDSFAASLKEGIGTGVFGLTKEQLANPVLKETMDPFWGLTPRDILQRGGTEAMRRVFGEDIWCRTVERRLQTDPPGTAVVISDVRFKSELIFLHQHGGFCVLVERPGCSKIDDQHQSERDLDLVRPGREGWDTTLHNDGTLAELKEKVHRLVQEMLSWQPAIAGISRD